jgi:hypothetical protein
MTWLDNIRILALSIALAAIGTALFFQRGAGAAVAVERYRERL